jgi:calcium-dependent protein kinase
MLLKMNPRDRFTAEQTLNHDWIKNKAPQAKNISLQSSFVDNLRGFRSQNKLKKAALQIIAGQLNENEIKNLRETFQALDHNGDGFLTAIEMRDGLSKAGLKEVPADLQAILEDVDADGSGVIDYTEFLAATLHKKLYMQEQQCWSAFRVFDRNGDGKISLDELKYVLQTGDVTDAFGKGQDIEALLKEVDTSGDGSIDFQEFMAMMRKGNPGDSIRM